MSKIERNLCYNKGETDVRSPSRYTRAGELHAAKCDLDYGRAVLPLLEARGDKVEARGEARNVVQSMAIASSTLGDWKTVAVQAGKLYEVLRNERDDYISLGIASDLLAEAQIQLKDFAGADRTISAQQPDAEEFYAAGEMLPLHYRNELVSIAHLRVQRLLAEDSRAAEAFPLARDIAERERTFRLGLSSNIQDETTLTRALQSTNRFTPVIDAAFSSRASASGDRDSALSAAFLAAQDATLDPTSIAIGMSAAALSSVSGDPELVRMVERRRLLLDELVPFLGVDAQTKFSLDPKEALVAKREEAAVQAKLEEYQRIDTALRERFPDYDKLVRPRALSVEEARALMQGDEATLLIVPTERGAHSLLVTREGVSWARAAFTSDQLADKVERLLWFAGGAVKPDAGKISTWEQAVDGGRNGFDRDTAFLLYEQLIGPHREALGGKRKLYVSALGSLSSLPLGLLVTAAPQGRDDDLDALRQTKWLGDELVIAQLPSLQSLAFLRRGSAPQSVKSGSFFGVGDPVLDPATSGEGSRGLERVIAPADIYGAPEEADAKPATLLADIESLRKLPELKGTGRELRAMAQALSAGEENLRLREQAREGTIKNEDLTGVSVLAFATHGLLAGELRRGQSPGLVLTPPDAASAADDGLLTAPEIARLKLAADWVILSACNTAAGDGSDGAGALSGIARAFFTAGARSLLVSHWPVLDDLSATVTVKAIALRRSTPALSSAEAFQQAQREIRLERRWAHPRSWAPFAFIGDASLPSTKTAQN